jgi:hypothetical protein
VTINKIIINEHIVSENRDKVINCSSENKRYVEILSKHSNLMVVFDKIFAAIKTFSNVKFIHSMCRYSYNLLVQLGYQREIIKWSILALHTTE